MSMKAVRIEFENIALRGGLDLLTPTLQLKPGIVKDALNWEQSIEGGYSRIAGYERFDGRTSPSDAAYNVVSVTVTESVDVGDVILGATSAATGTVISKVTNPDTSVQLVYTLGSGTFQVGETVTVGGFPVAEVSELGGIDTAPDWDVTQRALAANVYRALIQRVPGSGRIRGVAYYNGVLYAWRNNSGNTAQAIYKATTGGWVLVPLGFEIYFDNGSSEYLPGETLTQGIVDAVITRVALEGGSWGAGDAHGRIIFSTADGTFAAGAALGGGAADLNGPQAAITLLPGGRVQTDLGNFGQGAALYGCDGVNRGFEFDGTVYTPINTGNTLDKPDNVLVHQEHLWFGFGRSLQHSGIGAPLTWTALAGAEEFSMPENIQCLLRQPGSQETGVMSISLETMTKMMYGTGPFQLVSYGESAGAWKYSGQRMVGTAMVFGNIGIYSISTSQEFSNFAPSSLTMNIRPFTQTRRSLVTGSVVSREKSQYRVFFSDGFGLYMTFVNGKLIGTMPVYFPNPVACCCQGTSPNGTETAFFGGEDGYVYELEAGASHDGQAIQSYFTLTYAHQKNPQVIKSYMGAAFEVQGNSYATFDAAYELAYGSLNVEQGSNLNEVTVPFSSPLWDSMTWDAFVWDGKSLSPINLEIAGTGENVALTVRCNSDLLEQFTINSVVLRFKTRRILRF